MRRRVLVVRLERVRERLDGRDERALETLEVARVRDRELRLVGETAEQAQLSLAEVSGRDSRDDAADATGDDERRDRIRRIGVEWIVLHGRELAGPEDERLGTTRKRLRIGDVEAPLRKALAFLVGVPMQRARDDPAVPVLHPDGGVGRVEQARSEVDDPLEDCVEARGRRELPAEAEQRGGTFRLAARRLVETCVLDGDGGVAGQHLEQADVVLVELIEAELRDDDHADDASAVPQRHGQ